MRARLTAVTAVAALAALPAAASGAPARPQIRDMKGDVRGGFAYADILSAQWSTSGTGAAKRLVATLTLAAPPKKDVPYTYDMKSEVRDCGTMWFRYTPGVVSSRIDDPNAGNDPNATIWAECGPGAAAADGTFPFHTQLVFTQRGNTLSWSVPISTLPQRIDPDDAIFREFSAMADVGEPVTGHSVQGIADQSLDNAYGDGVWRMR